MDYYNREPIMKTKTGKSIPSRFNIKNRQWEIVSKEETDYTSNDIYVSSLEVFLIKKPVSLDDIPVKEVVVQSSKENIDNIYIGNYYKQPIVLLPDVAFSLPVDNLKDIYFKKKSDVKLNLDIFARINKI